MGPEAGVCLVEKGGLSNPHNDILWPPKFKPNTPFPLFLKTANLMVAWAFYKTQLKTGLGMQTQAVAKEKKIMEIAVKTFSPGLNSKIINSRQRVDVCSPKFSCKRVSFSTKVGHSTVGVWRRREWCRYSPALCAVLAGAKEVEVSSSQFEDFSITSTSINEAKELKISFIVFGCKTRVIFDNIFDKMVAAAQPIPGFRRVKGGKTPNIPRDILLEILGPSRVYMEVIKKIINSTVAEYVEKEGLKVSKNLRVEQSFEDLEDNFEPGEDFSFDAVVQLHETS